MTTLPSHWQTAPLGDVAETALGKMLDRGKVKGFEQVPYLRNVNVQWGRIDTHDLLKMEVAPEERERFQVMPGDLLVCEGGEIGRAAIWNRDVAYLAYQKALHRIRTHGRVTPGFLRYLLEHYSLNGTLRDYATGSTILHLPQQQLRRLKVPLPPLAEQRQIVDAIEDYFSRLGAAEGELGVAERKSSTLRALRVQELAIASTGTVAALGDVAVGASYGTSTKCMPEGLGPPVVRIPNLVDGRIDGSSQLRV